MLMLVCCVAFAEYSISLSDDCNLRVGADMRTRWEFFDRTVVTPDAADKTHPANQYLRIRTRAWMAFDVGEALTLNARFANRVHFVASSSSKPNNTGAATWKFPDEVYVDALNAVYRFFDKDAEQQLTLTVGRQSFSFGNGLIISDPTPFDQGRSAYTDGLRLEYADDASKVSLFVTYDSWKDRNVFINDCNRRLRSGDVFTAGIYGTRKVSDELNFDVYYIFNDVKDRQPWEAERNHPADANASIHTFGARLFGTLCQAADYSLEAAQQGGRNAVGGANNGHLIDARVGFHLPFLEDINPILKFEFTQFSGDKESSRRNEGKIPLPSQAPLWGDELLPIMFNGNWTNLNLYRTALETTPFTNTTVSLAATGCHTDRGTGSGDGRHIGTLLSAPAGYKFNSHLSFLAQLSHFVAANAFVNGHDSFWGRLEVTLSF